MSIFRKYISKIVFVAIIICFVIFYCKKIKAVNIFDYNQNFKYDNSPIIETTAVNIKELPDDKAIYINNNKNVTYKDILIIGDSYAYNFLFYTKVDCRFVVKVGYTVGNIREELLPLADFDGIKYCIIFIGPNDYMQQTSIRDFHYYFKSICNTIIDEGVTPVLISYMGVPYRDYAISEMQYKAAVYNLSMEVDCIYVDLTDFDKMCERNVLDNFVHHLLMFNILSYNRIFDTINEDRVANE